MEHHPSLPTATKDGIRVYYCIDCGFIHQFPLPDEKEVAKYYEDDKFYTTFSPPSWFQNESIEHSKGLWNARYQYELNLAKKYLPTTMDTKHTILDIGSGLGWFPAYARQHGWWAYGYEPSKSARAYTNLWFNTGIFPTGQFSVLRASLVLEHLANPIKTVTEWRDKIQMGGLLLVCVPSDFSLIQMKIKSNHFIAKPHLNYFTPSGLRNLMHKTGFEIVHESVTAPLDIFLLLGYDYRTNHGRGQRVHSLRLQLERVFGTHMYDLYKKLYNKFQMGRELIFIARRV